MLIRKLSFCAPLDLHHTQIWQLLRPYYIPSAILQGAIPPMGFPMPSSFSTSSISVAQLSQAFTGTDLVPLQNRLLGGKPLSPTHVRLSDEPVEIAANTSFCIPL